MGIVEAEKEAGTILDQLERMANIAEERLVEIDRLQRELETTKGLWTFWNDKAVELAGKLSDACRKAFAEAAEIAEAHASQCRSKLNKKRSDHDLAVFESAMSEADSITLAIRARAEG